MTPPSDTEQPEDVFARVRESWWVVVPFVLIGLLVAGHVFTFEWSPEYQRAEWLRGVKPRDVDGVLFINAAILASAVMIFAVVERLSRTPRWVHVLKKIILVTLVVVNGFTYFYVRRSTLGRWWHCYDSYHYALNPMFQEELGYDKLYECTVEASPRKKVWDKTVVRDLSTYGFTRAKKVRESAGPSCQASMSPERWAEFDAAMDIFLDTRRCGPGRVRSALGDQGYNGTPFHTAMIRAYFSAVPFDRLGLTFLALVDVFALLLAHAFMTRAVGWRHGYVFSAFAFTLSVDRYAIIGGSSFRFIWLALLIIAVACLVRRRWAAAAACLTVSAMLTVFPLLFGVGALLALAGRAFRHREALADLRRFVLSGLLTAALCGAVSVTGGAGFSQYSDFMHDMRVHSEGPPNARLGGRLEKTPGYGVGLKFVFAYRGENGKPHVGYDRVKLTKEFARIEPLYRAIGWGLTSLAAVLAFSLAAAEASVMFGFIAFYALLGTVGYYFSCASLVCIACLFAHRRASGTFMFLLFLLTSVVGLHHAASDIYTKESLYRTLTSMSWGIWIVAWLVWTAARTGLMRISEERPPP